MKENQLLETLAQNLGTTVEYLWSVLLKQAPISATIDLLTCILLTLIIYDVYRLHKYFSAPSPDADKYYTNRTRYDDNDTAILIMVSGTMASAIMLIIIICTIPDIINGYFNPEYWALKEILNSVK